jgi:hypothetical protein
MSSAPDMATDRIGIVERDYGKEGSLRSAADIVGQESLLKVRDFKEQMKAAARAQPQGPGARPRDCCCAA